MTERLHFDFSLSCIGEGNSNPLQGSCLENPRDRGAWRAAVCGVAQSQTRLKQLSSSSSSSSTMHLKPKLPLFTSCFGDNLQIVLETHQDLYVISGYGCALLPVHLIQI